MIRKFIIALILLSPSVSLANTVRLKVYAINLNSQEIIQKCPENCLTISVTNSQINASNNEDGLFLLEFGENHPPGKRVPISINKPGWKIVSHPKNLITIPSEDVTEPIIIKLAHIAGNGGVLNKKQPQPQFSSKNDDKLLYTIQVFVTEEKNKADEIVAVLKSKGFPAYSKKNQLKLDGSGFEDKVFVGKYKLKSQAKQVIKELKLHTRINSAFIQKQFE